MSMNLLTEGQLSLLLNVSPRTLQTQRQKGSGIPFIKIGKSVRYDLNVVRDFIQKNLYTSTSMPTLQPINLVGVSSLQEINSS